MQPLTWNADQEIIGKTRRGRDIKRTDIRVKWTNFLDEGRKWQRIDMRLSPRVNVYEMRKAPFQAELPVMSTGKALFIADNRYSPKTRSQITDNPFNVLVRPIGPLIKSVVGDFQGGDKIVYKGAYGEGADYILQTYHGRTPRLRKLVQINKAPVSDLKLEFEIELPDKYDISLKDLRNEAIISKDATIYKQGSLSRAISFSRARIWDSNFDEPKQAFVQTSLRMQGGRLILTKYISTSFFKDVVFPVFTDTDFYTEVAGTIDGDVGDYVGDTWATVRAAPGDRKDDTDTKIESYYALATTTSDQWGQINRGIYTIDTSAIGTDSISAAVWNLYGNAKANTNSWTAAQAALHIVSSAPANPAALANGDFDSLGVTSFGSFAYADWSTVAYNQINMDANGIANINKTGISLFGSRSGADLSDSNPAWASGGATYIRTVSDDAGSNGPYLSVTHAPAAAALLNRVIGVV